MDQTRNYALPLNKHIIVQLLLALIASTAFASTPGPINSCQTIDTPGTYTFSEDINAVGTCFTITADDVTIDGNNYKLFGDGNTSAPFFGVIAEDKNAITLRDFNLTNFTNVGVWFKDVNYFLLSGMNVGAMVGTFNSIRGPAYYTIGVLLAGSNNGTIQDSNFSSNESGIDIGSGGISTDSENNIITNCTFTNHNSYSIDFYGINNTISNSSFTNNAYGIWTSAATSHSGYEYGTITGNYIANNNAGLRVGSSYATVSSNIITNNTTTGIDVTLSNNTFSNNIISSNGTIELKIDGSYAKHNIFIDNNITSASTWIFLNAGKSGAPEDTNFTNTTFKNQYGAITIIPRVTFPKAVATLNTTQISITDNNAFLNSTYAPYLNTNSKISFYNQPEYSGPSVKRNGDFCTTPVCSSVTSLGDGNYQFDVNGFSYYSISDSKPSIQITSIDGFLTTQTFPIFSAIKDGNITINFNVSDPDSNNILVDINYSTNNSIGTGTPIVTRLDLNSLPETGPHSCQDTNFMDATPCSVEWDTAGVTDGNYYIVVYLSDGNNYDQNSTITSFMVDNTPPNVSITTPTNNTTITESTVQINFSGTDSNSGISAFYFSENNADWISSGMSTSHTFTNQTNGQHTYYVKAMDVANNTSSIAHVTITITVGGGYTPRQPPNNSNEGTPPSSPEDILKGFHKSIGVLEETTFIIANQTHHIKIISIGEESATIQVMSNPQEAVLAVGETKKFEINGDNFYDLNITLLGIEDNNAILFVKSINEKINNSDTTPNTTDNNHQTQGIPTTTQTPKVKNENTQNTPILIFAFLAAGAIVFIFFMVKMGAKKVKKLPK